MKNKRLRRHVLSASCGVIAGDRGAGKSTFFALIADTFLAEGYDVYCQYPYKDCYQIPLKATYVNGVAKYDIDKTWLYTTNLSHSCILIDEARTVWPARSYSKWTVSDDEFFNFIRKNDIHVFLATQAYDALDLNIRRAADYTYYMTLGFLHFSHIETSKTTLAKVADKNTEVLGRMFKRGMQKVSYDICEVPSGNFLFWRRKWYNKFISTHTFYEKPFKEAPKWDEILDFETLQKEQGYIDDKTLSERFRGYFEAKNTISVDEYDDEEEENQSEDLFLGVDLNDESLDLDFEPTKKLGFKERIKRMKRSKQPTTDLFDLVDLPVDTSEDPDE